MPSDASEPRARVLVVDDESVIVRAVERVLRAVYDVRGAGGGREAIARLEAGERFDVILCDMEMAEGSGIDLHAYLAQVDPALGARIVFLTGGACSDAAARFLANVPNRRLEKPFTREALLGEVSAALTG